ncbi:methyltransferase domain-containing protein [Hydrogenivirga sp. 128-5-R1-1]|uniref:class I SAM-dependent methyltransferase n=1 Tax=Hydrogenivirga sp. 128-5-R1-1 TaxID=392423 RepID=UPI00015EF792|nr:methyltransferase domain-containing protein [Hydrogenivirga sp. 128-5-R1-1]EDP74908.1 Methyltransferase type 11 [Hydrogenivirga sp. 128-5-R1-1]
MEDLPIKDFWEEQGKRYKDNIRAVNFDPLLEELELFFLERVIKDGEIVCDVGCGNGRTLLQLAQSYKGSTFYGIDFAESMIEVANKSKDTLGVENVHFYRIDATSEKLRSIFELKFDTVITKRLLINLRGKDKFKVIENIYDILKDRGTYVMIECFTEPLDRVNRVRKELGLDEIKIKFFNEYLSCEFLEKISDKFIIENKIDFGSLYYFISRIFNAYLSEGEPDYYSPINKLALRLTKMGVIPIEGFSPEILFVLKKV